MTVNLFAVMLAAVPSSEGAWRMNPALTASLAVGLVAFYAVLILMLRRKTLALKYTLVWMLSGLALAVFLIFPQVVLGASELIGVSNPVNAVFLLFAGFSLLLTLSLTSIASQLAEKNRKLVQNVALLEQRVRDLEEDKRSK